jgi:hypothetical protein
VIVTSTDNDDLIKVIGCHGLNDNISTAFSGAAAGALFQTGNNIDGYGVNVLSGATVVPDPLLKGKYIRIQGQTTGAAYVLGALAVNPLEKGFTFTIEFFNNAGGAVTGWTLNAMYHVAAAIPTADLAKTAVTFRWDGISSVCREVSRAQTI